MAYTQSSNKAVQKYSKKAYDSALIRVKKGQLEQIQAYAERKGMSLNGYINALIAADMGAELTRPEPTEEK